MRNTGIDRIMTPDPITIGPDESVAQARETLQSHVMHHLPVVEDGKLIGLLSASDVMNRMLFDENLSILASIPVRRLMQENPYVLDENATLRKAAEKLASGAFHSLPVVKPDRTLVGIVTSSDLILHLLQRLPTGDDSTGTYAGLRATDIDISATLDAVEQAAASGELSPDAARTFRWLHQRNRDLDTVVDAVERYIHSGLADHEHSVLVKSLAKLREIETRLNL